MTDLQETTAETLREIRGSFRATQADVANVLGIDNSAVSSVETGRRDLTHAERLVLNAYFFGASLPEVAAK